MCYRSGALATMEGALRAGFGPAAFLLGLATGGLVLLVACGGASRRSDQPVLKRLYVQEFTCQDCGLTPSVLMQLTDEARGAALVLPRDQWLVLTRETVLELLPPGREWPDCGASCELEIARQVGSDATLTGVVRRVAGEYVVSMNLYDVRTGALESQNSLDAPDVPMLRQRLRLEARRMYGAIGGAAAGTPGPRRSGEPRPGPASVVAPPPTSGVVEALGTVRPEMGFLRVEGSPRGALVRILGPWERRRATIRSEALPFGPESVPAGEYQIQVSAEGYDPVEVRQFVGADRNEVVRVDLVPSEGVLQVLGTPEGARTEVHCARGFHREFGLPGTLRVPRGTCRVEVSRAGYGPFAREVPVPGGETVPVEVRLVPAGSPAADPGKGKGDQPAKPTWEGNWGWNRARPLDWNVTLGLLGFQGLLRGPDHYMLTLVPVQVGLLAGGRWRLGAFLDLGMLFNSDSPKHTAEDNSGDLRMVVGAGGYAGMMLVGTKDVGLWIDGTAAFQYNEDRCTEWDMSVEKDRQCTGHQSIPNGFVYGGRVGFRWIVLSVVLQVDHSLVNGVSLGGFIALSW